MPVIVEFALARPADAARIAAMSRDLVEAGLEWRWRNVRVLKQILHPEVNVLAARGNGSLIGFAIMHYHSETAHLLLLAVNPAYRRRGIGRRMVEWLEKAARVAGIAQVQLEVRARNQVSRQFYQVLGYQETQIMPHYYYGREAAVRLQHDLRLSV
jgi:ribosomal-protein-alanine N-acetyltransferase